MAKSDVLVRMKADVSNYDANIAKARRTLDGFKQDNLTLGGILNQTTKSLAAAAAGFASVTAIAGTISDLVSESVELAKAGEGIRVAFERLNDPGLLDNLREATHNTVNDIELMKAAVKFNDFKLPVEELGTMLAFAQQKAKDTGQSVDYMVDSIVTGLGRKSLMILDNLGLSANEIKEKMQETGDMTKAVGEIIREQMASAGDYVETASDRAAQAQVRLDNAMTELGNTMQSLSGTGAMLWTDLKIGAIDLLNTAIKPLITAFNALADYVNGTSVEDIITNGLTDVTDTVDDNGRLIRKDAITQIPEIVVGGDKTKTKKKTGVKTGKTNQPTIDDFNRALGKSLVGSVDLKETKEMLSPYMMMLPEIKKHILDIKDADLGGAMAEIGNKEVLDGIEAVTRRYEQQEMAANLAAQAAMNLGAALSGIEDPGLKAAGTVMSAIANIALGFAMASKQADAIGSGWGWIAWLAAGTAAMATTISTIHSLTGYAHGGIVSGNSYSGDNIPIMANAGEVVLTKAAQASLANHLENADAGGGMSMSRISGEQIYVTLNRYLKRTGQGELVTW